MGVLSDINRKRKKATKKILNPFVKAAGKISDKLIPNELRFLAPYAAAAGTIMLPPGMGPWMRAMSAAGLNVAGQIAADETPIEDISDINAISAAIAGGIGALGSGKVSGDLRSGIESGMSPQEAANIYGRGTPEALAAEGTLAGGGTGAEFLQGAENVGREGLASLSDYMTGGREALIDIGRNPQSLFEYNKGLTLNKAPGVTKALSALGPAIAHGTGDVFYEGAVDLKDEADRLQAEEEAQMKETTTADETDRAYWSMRFMREAGHDEETVKETLAQNDLEEYYEAPEGAAQGGRIGYGIGGWLKSKLGIGGRKGTAYASGNRAAQDPEVLREKLLEYFKNKYGGEEEESFSYLPWSQGGIVGLRNGGMLNLGGNEMDYRGGGFVPIGKRQRADDVPARLSKNEFVMTADAVKAAGGGSVNKGAQRMYNVMNQLEARA